MKKTTLIIVIILVLQINAQQFTVRDHTLLEIADAESNRNIDESFYIRTGAMAALFQSAFYLFTLTNTSTFGCYLNPLFYLSFIPLGIFILRGIKNSNRSIYLMEKYGDEIKDDYKFYLTVTTVERIVVNFLGSYLMTICGVLLTISIVWYMQ
ncbi:TPA: hypothetical protein DCW38_07355 [candidate division WOR-3 bacterium]|uniref:Uncharacterized protein n=1 Tax=candidate division WOR-3 bacterium TaxID=2052148 RepID=A0A350HBR0_UNCW3|nr:hypothetical protein [candidate division WOR-3 bacterium]